MSRLLLARLCLQIAVALGAVVPILAGLMGILLGPGMAGDDSPMSASLDSHYRYLSGLLLGIGIGFYLTIPAIEKNRIPFQFLTLIVVIGGAGRLYSLTQVGVPAGGMIFGLVMELIITPLLALCQFMLARAALKTAESP